MSIVISIQFEIKCRLQTRDSRQENTGVATEPTVQFTDAAAFVFASEVLAHRVQIPSSDTPPRNRYRPSEGHGLDRTPSESVLHDESNRHEIFHASPRTYDGDDDVDLTMPECIEISDFESNFNVSHSRVHEADIENTRDTESHMDAPPSYLEATALAPPLETAFSIASESPSLPSYGEFLANQINYVL